jgi:hypothetical protein
MCVPVAYSEGSKYYTQLEMACISGIVTKFSCIQAELTGMYLAH